MKFIRNYFKRRLVGSFALVAAFLLTACASLEDNLTSVPIASINHYDKGMTIAEYFVNGKPGGANIGGYSSPMISMVLEKDFKGPLTLNVKWEVCNFKHFIKNEKRENLYCIDESYEATVPVHVVNTPGDSAYLYLHFFNDNSVEAWMTKFLPERKNYPGPAFPHEK